MKCIPQSKYYIEWIIKQSDQKWKPIAPMGSMIQFNSETWSRGECSNVVKKRGSSCGRSYLIITWLGWGWCIERTWVSCDHRQSQSIVRGWDVLKLFRWIHWGMDWISILWFWRGFQVRRIRRRGLIEQLGDSAMPLVWSIWEQWTYFRLLPLRWRAWRQGYIEPEK